MGFKSNLFSETINVYLINLRMKDVMTYCRKLGTYEKSNVLKKMLQNKST